MDFREAAERAAERLRARFKEIEYVGILGDGDDWRCHAFFPTDAMRADAIKSGTCAEMERFFRESLKEEGAAAGDTGRGYFLPGSVETLMREYDGDLDDYYEDPERFD